MQRSRQTVSRRAALLALAILVAPHAVDPAAAQSRFEGRYIASLAGIPIGKGLWVIDITDDHYTAAASGTTTGLLRLFAGGQGSSASRGYVSNGNLVPVSFASTVVADKKTEELRITLQAGTVKEFTVSPPTPPDPGRVPLTEAHRRGVTDPMTAVLVRVAGDPLSPEACNRTIPVFDGRMRYDVRLTYKRLETVKAEKGYQGPAVVCGMQFIPIAGHIPDRAAIKYLTGQRNMEVWLAPIAQTQVAIPFRVVIPTPIGVGVLQATHFVSMPQPPRLTPTGAKLP